MKSRTALAAVTAVPDGTRRLSHGIVVEGKVLARLLGIRLLTLDASVVIAPAEVGAPGRDVDDQAVLPPAQRRVAAPERPPVIGGGLADAVRVIDEGAASLAAARRNGSGA